MRHFIVAIIAMALLALPAMADPKPKYLDGATVTVTLKDGKTYTFSSDQWKVVPRVETKAKLNKTKSLVVMEKKAKEKKKFHVTAHAGIGYDGIKTIRSKNKKQMEVIERRAPVFGISLGYDIFEEYHVMGSMFTNGTIVIGGGKDF